MKVPVVHYLNQFFAGIGGEDKASVPLDFVKGAVGPGKRLQNILKESAEIVITIYCGDNYFVEHKDDVLASILKIIKDCGAEILVAGPAFSAGRYGFACTEVCHFVSTSLELDCVTGMSIDNPGLEGYKQYKDRRVFAFPTRGDAAGMNDALASMAPGILKLTAGSAMGPASEEGYISRGIRVLDVASKSGAKRAVDMILDKMAGRPFATETPLEIMEETPIAQRIVNIKDAHLALAASAGVHLAGNPAGFLATRNTKWTKYSIDKLNSMKDAKWMVIHGGIDNVFIEKNPNYGVPLDVCREREREGVFAKLNPNYYATTGCGGAISDMQTIGKEILAELKAEGVNGVLMVST